jgi:nuclear pore complex protein Nup155
MTILVNNQIKDEMGVDVISNILQQRCPSICEKNDVILYKGMELLQSAKATSIKDQRDRILLESQRYMNMIIRSLFRSIIKSVSIDRLREVTGNYTSLHFFTGKLDETYSHL